MAKVRRIGLALSFAFALALGGNLAHAQSAQSGSQNEAAPATQLFIFLYRAGPAWRAGVPMMEQGLGPHAAYIRGLQVEGRLFAAGPFLEANGALADGGMAIVRAANMDEARALLAADPAITSGLFVGEVERWTARFRNEEPIPGD